MGYELIITEKPSAAQKIADALSDSGKAVKKSNKGVGYFEISHNKKPIIITSAVGHLYTVDEKEKGKWKYPVYDITWVPSHDRKGSEYTKKYLDNIKKLAKNAMRYTIATDYDIEGEVIGLNIVKYACGQKDARRMKYSTLTKPDLIESYNNASEHLDWGQAHAGETRHFLDWLYGINLSRALTLSIKNSTGNYKIMSAGRVQGPALKMVVDKEKEIKKFVSKPFWEIEMKYVKSRKTLLAKHKKMPFWKKSEADAVIKKTKGNDAIVVNTAKKEVQQAPPVPFDLTTLQLEAHRVFGIPPKRTLEIAQELYIAGATSYPRTSSQKLPATLGYKKIITALAKQAKYKPLSTILLGMPSLKPNEGKKNDAAHPAIYPTGQIPKDTTAHKGKIYDLIVKRFFATFGEPALRESVSIHLEVSNEPFSTTGSRTTFKGWHELYAPYVKLDEIELPHVEIGEALKVKSIKEIEKETQPPRRYTEASIIKELEKRGLGTKATRAAIIESLVLRKYITEKPVEATELGIATSDVLHKYCPQILEEEMTKEMEIEMEKIRQKNTSPKKVLDKAKVILDDVLKTIKEKEKPIGKELAKANIDMQKEINTLGPCPICKKDDAHLVIKRGKFGRFVACDQYPEHKLIIKIPQTGYVTATDKICEHCGYPIVNVGKQGKRPHVLCLNPDCPGKKINDPEIKHETKELNNGAVQKECPKCGNPLVLRQSIYGKFLGCSTFPKCRYMEPLKDGPLKEDFPKKTAADPKATNEKPNTLKKVNSKKAENKTSEKTKPSKK